MTATDAVIPAARPVDLTDCDREPIHLAGGVQPVGFLVALTADWLVSRVSANVQAFLGVSVSDMLGASLRDIIDPEAAHAIRNRLAALRGDDAVERAFGIVLQAGGAPFDLAIYMVGLTVVLECEPSEPRTDVNAGTLVRSMIGRLQDASSFADFTREAARQIRSLTGFDRVMVYHFQADGSGEVIAESARGQLEPFIGLRYPASDIPRQARALYERNLLRLISDVGAAPVPIVPVLDPRGEPLDLSLSVLRAVSPIHLQYLRNMGVYASMSISILRRGKLWGLIACHHRAPRHVGFERRTTAELFVQMFSLLIESRERDEEAAYEARTRLLHNKLMAAMAAEASTADNIAELAEKMAELVPCDGIGVWVDGQATLLGSTPSRDEFVGLMRVLNRAAASQIYATAEIGAVDPAARTFTERAAGLLAIPISRTPRDYLVFFRRELARTVTWAGNPDKPVEAVATGERLTPRKSFEAWREIVRGQSVPWTDAELRTAEALRITLLEVVLRLADVAQKERRAATEKQNLLIAELNHRVRNILGLVNGLVSQSRASVDDVDAFAAVLGGRVQALARAHDQLTADNWGPASFESLLATEAGPYLSARSNCVQTGGPAVLLKPRAFSTLALVIHELMTNSAKYGALSNMVGQVSVEWSFDEVGALVINWREAGGPAVQAPTRRGFGTTIIDRSIRHELEGEAVVEYLLAGMRARFTVPAEFVVPGVSSERTVEERPDVPVTARLSGTVLLVEDSMIIALDAEEMLLGLGASRVDTASNTEDAMALLDQETPDFAVLDVNLGSQTSFAIAGRLLVLGVPFVFATGYGDDLGIPDDYAGTPIVKKPYTADAIARAVRSI